MILDLDNGICLCWACHKHYAHERFEEFRDLVIAKRGETAYMRLKFVALNGSPMDFELCKMVLETLLKNGKELRDGTHN